MLGRRRLIQVLIHYQATKMGTHRATSYDVMGREYVADELARMPDQDCILIIRGIYPFYSKKYEVNNHKNYKYTYESDPHYLFDYRTVRRVRKIENKVELSKGKRPEENELIRERGYSIR